ncbi:MAG: S53 family peptidase [Terracidiphilus sp.]
MSNRFLFRGRLAASALIFAGLACAASACAGAQARVRGPIDETHRVVLSGNTRPEANAENDLGPVEDSLTLEHMQLLLRRPEELQQQLDAYTESLADRSSPNYHHWLTPDEFGARFGVAQDDIDAVTGWLELHGFQVNTVYPNRLTIDFSGSAAEVREAFLTEIHYYDVKGVRHIANDRDPRIPAALAPAITGIVSMHDFRPHPMYKPRAQYTYGSGNNETWAVTPADLATIYNLNPLFKKGLRGKGQTIVVIEDTNVYSTADWTNFRKAFGLSGYTAGSFKQVHPAPKSGANNCANPGVNPDGDDMEAILDAEYASAAAPGATIELASCNNTNTTFGGQIALQNILNESKTPPALISMSYGDCEPDNTAAGNQAFRRLFQQAVNEGVSVFVSAGDEGAASCDAGDNVAYATHGISVSGFASTQYNVAVGGTDFADTYLNDDSTYWDSTNTAAYGSAKSYIPEIPWNDSCASVLFAKNASGSSITYGKSGFCNSQAGENSFLNVIGGSGGPSSCATGTPSITDVVSGTCKGWAKPSWQSLVGVPADGVRDIPDVSLFAANGFWGHYYVICFTDPGNGGAPCKGAPSNWAGGGGTSFSSPIMAGIQALVNQKTGARHGNPNPVYYEIARSEYGAKGSATCNSSKGKQVGASCVFYDVTLGDMDMVCRGAGGSVVHSCYLDGAKNGVLSTSNTSYEPAYKTGTGWDFATGIGTVNAYNLVFSSDW